MYSRLLFFVSSVLLAIVIITSAQQATTSPPLTPEQQCNQYNGSNSNCSFCTNEGPKKNAQDLRCYWCGATKACKAFGFTVAIPINGIDCPQLKYHVGTCALDVLSIIIIIAVACVVLLVLIICVCCCCCIMCANRRRKLKMKEETRYLEEKDGIRQKSADRRAERKAKHDEIRRKYGLNADDATDGNYKRFN